MATIKATVFRYNPETDSAPTYQTYEVPWPEPNDVQDEHGNVLQLLKAIYEHLDGTLAFPYYSCGYKFCNGCMMKINGIAAHACGRLVRPGDELLIEPMPGYPIIRDLIVDWGRKYVTPHGTYQIRRGAVIREVKTD